MSTEIKYGNLEFMQTGEADPEFATPKNAYIQSVFGDRNFASKVFSGAKRASAAWGWQFKQFTHADSDFKTVYRTRRITYTNRSNGATQTDDQTYPASGVSFTFQTVASIWNPSRDAFFAGGGSLTVVGFDAPTSPTSRPVRLSGSSPGYTAVQTLEGPISFGDIVSRVRSAINNPPDPDYEDLSGSFLWLDSIAIAPDGNTTNTRKTTTTIDSGLIDSNRPFLIAFIAADLTGNPPNQYYNVTGQKVGFTILNTFKNAITSKKYCGDSWKWTQIQSNSAGTFAERNNCRMVTRPAGPGKVVIVVGLPGGDPDVDTRFLKSAEVTANMLYMPPIPEDLNTPRLGYPANGYNQFGTLIYTLPPPGACCDLTP